MTGTLILFGRFVISIFSHRVFQSSFVGIEFASIMFGLFRLATLDLAAVITVKAVIRLDIDANPMPVWLLSEFSSESDV